MQTDSIVLNDKNKESFTEKYSVYFLYTLAFAIVYSLIFLFYIKESKSFIQYGDGYRQGYFWMIEFKDAVDKLLSGGGVDFWNWSAGLGRTSRISAFFDPFQWLAILFVPKHPELGYTISISAQMYCSGLAFILAAKKFEIKKNALVLGAVSYVFCSWVLNTALIQGFFIFNLILFPLLVLGVEKIYDGNSPVLFTLVVAYYLIRMPYFAYMAAIMIVIYIALRYFARINSYGFFDFLKNMGIFVLYGFIGIMISMFILISSYYSLSGASIDSGMEYSELLFPKIFYKNLIQSLLGTFPVWGNYMFLGLSSVTVILFIYAFKRFSFKNTPLVMSVISIIFVMFPFFNKMFNGFSYPTGRWYFIMIFFIVITAMQSIAFFDRKKLSDKLIVLATFVIICIAIVITLFPNDYNFSNIFSSLKSVNFFAICINVMIALCACVALILFKNNSHSTGINAVTALLLITMAGSVLMWTPMQSKRMRAFFRDSEIEAKLSNSVQRAGQYIKDNDFFRIDQVGGISVHKTLSKYANETLRWRTRSIYTYDSKVPASLLYYNKMLGNNEDYVERVTLFSNDNRAGLDLLTGVKYFLGDDKRTGSDMSQYSGYGFDNYKTLNGVSVLKNKYSIGLGTGYDSYMTSKEYEKLSRLEREQALLQAVVLGDEDIKNGDAKGLKQLTAKKTDTKVRRVVYTERGTENVKIRNGIIDVRKNNAKLVIQPLSQIDGQLFLSFDNLRKINNEGLISNAFSLECIAGNIKKVLMNKLGNQGIYNITDYDVNFDYMQGFDGPITIIFKNAGTYSFDRMYLSCMDMSRYEKYASELQSKKLAITKLSNDSIEGKISASANEILYLSIPANLGWTACVDGKKQHVIRDVNYAFTGLRVPKGNHSISLKYNYPGKTTGCLISASGLILLIVFSVVRRKRTKTRSDIKG